MKLTPVSLEALSDIHYSVALGPGHQSSLPEFLYVAFTGVYPIGSAGATDAKFLDSMMVAFQRAWHAESLIVDLSGLDYQWGDQMDFIFDVGYELPSRCHKPLAIIVGDGCRDALKTLSPEDFERHCVESLEDAVSRIRALKPEYEAFKERWRHDPGKA